MFLFSSFFIRVFFTKKIIAYAKLLNRNSTAWGIFTFCLPTLALIIIGLLHPLQIRIKFPFEMSKNEKVKKIIAIADKK